MYCERCNIEFQEGLRFCKWCGNTLTERRRVTSELHGCPSCAAPIQSNWAFCKACGVKLNAPVSETGGEFCPRCGSKSDPTWLNCARCGEDLGRVKAPKHTAITSMPGRSVLTHCAECGDKLEAGATYCKGCGAAIYTPSNAFGASSLLCRVCNSYSPLGSAECRVCGAQFGGTGEGAATGKKSSTLPDLAEHLPVSGHFDQNSETVMIEQVKEGGEVISGAHTLIIGPSGAIEPPPLADESLQSEDSTGRAAIVERPAGSAETTVLPGVAGSKSEQPSPTSVLTESRITGPVDEEPVKDTVEEEAIQIEAVKLEAAEIKAAEMAEPPKRNPLSTQLDMPAIRLDELKTLERVAEKPPEQIESQSPGNATIVMGSISASKEPEAIPEDSSPLYRNVMTAPFGLEQPEAEQDIAAPVIEDEPPAESAAAHTEAARTRELDSREPAWNAVPPVAKTVGQGAVVTRETESNRAESNLAPSIRPSAVAPSVIPPPQAQNKAPMLVSIIAAVLVVTVGAFVLWWFLFSGSKLEPSKPEVVVNPPAPVETPPAPPRPPEPAKPVVPEGMVFVPGGDYTIGRDDGDAIARPAHAVTLSPFFIDRTEVTNAEYKKFVDATAHKAPSDWKDGSYPAGRDNWPVTNVSWQDATDYAEWIGKRLPTEAEWEAAARGTDNRLYPWGNEWRPSYANVQKKGITEVGQYRDGASPVGALDMIGNVWELTSDLFELYPGSTAAFPPTKEPGITYYVIRGGAFDSDKRNDATRRGFLEANKGYPKTGFRLAKDAK
jgi:formylglycine-generating enzyme required for sulfatase activity/ribosomal protein L40E